MSAWFAIPSAKPLAEAQACVDQWHRQGYKVALWRDESCDITCDMLLVGQYPGYANAVNALCKEILARDPRAAWIATGGDDTEPDMRKCAEEIAAECTAHFDGTFGVMQPTGDRWADSLGVIIERIAGSPWMGAEFCRRMYGGVGPMWPGWQHFFVDNEIMEVSKILGVFWQRPDVTHTHNHWVRERRPMPSYIAHANEPEHWRKFKPVYEQRKAQGFPGHQPISVEAVAA